jgi:hypothetical protein
MKRFLILWGLLAAAYAFSMAAMAVLAGQGRIDRLYWTALALVPLAQAAVLQFMARFFQKKHDERE